MQILGINTVFMLVSSLSRLGHDVFKVLWTISKSATKTETHFLFFPLTEHTSILPPVGEPSAVWEDVAPSLVKPKLTSLGPNRVRCCPAYPQWCSKGDRKNCYPTSTPPPHAQHNPNCSSFPCHYILAHISDRSLLLNQKPSQYPEPQRIPCQIRGHIHHKNSSSLLGHQPPGGAEAIQAIWSPAPNSSRYPLLNLKPLQPESQSVNQNQRRNHLSNKDKFGT